MPSPRALAGTAAALFGVVVLASGAALLGGSGGAAAGIAAAAGVLGLAVAALAAAPRRSARRTSERDTLADGLFDSDALACYTLDREGRVGFWSLGAETLFGWTAAEMQGRAIGATIHAPAQESELLAEVAALFQSGRVHSAHRRSVTTRSGRTLDTVCAVVPLVVAGRVERVAVLHVDLHAPHLVEGRWHGLFHAAPAGLLGVGGDGRIDAVNRWLAVLVGRRVDALQGSDVGRSEVLPPDFREELRAAAAEALERSEPRPFEREVTLVGADGAPRSVHAFVAPRPGGGVDAVLVDGASRQQLASERDSARAAAAAARETASEAVTSHKDLTSSVAELMSALEAARERSGGEPARRASAEKDVERSGRILLANIERLDESGRRAKVSLAPQVLLVDDNDENRELIAHMLKSRGAEVRAVPTGREALDAVSRAWFDVVLLDVQMPEMDGYEVVRRIRAMPGGETVSVVALTALGSETIRERCLAEGMDDFVSKPLTLAKVNELLERWGKREPPESQPAG